MAERKYVSQRRKKSNISDYFGPSSYIIPEEQAKENRYIYFDKFKDFYAPNTPIIDEEKILNDLTEMLRQARDIQLEREKTFTKKIKDNTDKNISNFDPDLITPNMSSDTFQNYQNFLENALTIQGMRDSIFTPLTKDNTIFLTSVRKALDQMLLDGKNYTKIMEKDETAFTERFRSLLWDEIVSQLINNGVNIDPKKLKLDSGISEALSGFGKITSRSKSKIYRYLKNAKTTKKKQLSKRNDKIFQDLNFSGLHSNLIGMADEIGNYLAFYLKSELPSGGKISYTAAYKGSENKKTDISLIVGFPEEFGNQLLQQVNISAKAASLIKEGFRTQAKFAEKSSLQQRYDEIRKFLGNKISERGLNEVFYHINNQLANRNPVEGDSILNILSFASLNFMFEGMVEEIKSDSLSKGDLNFFLLAGQLIPSSTIFDLMLVSIEDSKANPRGIARASFEGPPITPRDYYYNKENYEEVSLMYPGNTTEGHRHLPWERMRDWLEKKSKMGFYLNTARIFKMLELDRAKRII